MEKVNLTIALGNNFRIESDQLLEAYNGGQCSMVKCDNNIKRKSISRGITIHNFNKGYSQGYSNLFSSITQQIIKCPTYIERRKPFSYLLHNSMFLSNLHEKTSNKT